MVGQFPFFIRNTILRFTLCKNKSFKSNKVWGYLLKFTPIYIKFTTQNKKVGKSILQVPDTGTRVLDNTRPFLCSSIASF